MSVQQPGHMFPVALICISMQIGWLNRPTDGLKWGGCKKIYACRNGG